MINVIYSGRKKNTQYTQYISTKYLVSSKYYEIIKIRTFPIMICIYKKFDFLANRTWEFPGNFEHRYFLSKQSFPENPKIYKFPPPKFLLEISWAHLGTTFKNESSYTKYSLKAQWVQEIQKFKYRCSFFKTWLDDWPSNLISKRDLLSSRNI